MLCDPLRAHLNNGVPCIKKKLLWLIQNNDTGNRKDQYCLLGMELFYKGIPNKQYYHFKQLLEIIAISLLLIGLFFLYILHISALANAHICQTLGLCF